MKNENLGFKIKSFEPEDEQGVFVGLANKRWFKDRVGDVTTDTAFTNSIKTHKEKGTLPKLLLQHDPNKIVGVFLDIWEDSEGLWVKGKLCLDTVLGKETYSLMKMGAISDLSIGYRVIEEKYDRETKTNYLTEVTLHEVSLVVFPCNTESNIVSVKSEELHTPNSESNITSVKSESIEEVQESIEEANTVAIEEIQPIQLEPSVEENNEVANAEEEPSSKKPDEVAEALLDSKLSNFLFSVKLNSFLKNL